MDPNKEFYTQITTMAKRLYTELEEIHKFASDNEIKDIGSMTIMLGSMQTLSVSIDTIAKMILRNYEDMMKVGCNSNEGNLDDRSTCSPDAEGFGHCGQYLGFTQEEAIGNCIWAEIIADQEKSDEED